MNRRQSMAINVVGVALFIAALMLPQAARAQQILRDVTINFMEVTRLSNIRTEVRAYVTVTDLNGEPLTDLDSEHFVLIEDGVPVIDLDVQSASTGMFVVLLMDTTTSMGTKGLAAAQSAADSFVAGLATPDQVALYEFQEEAVLLEDFTPDHNRVRNTIASLQLVDKWTCLYDATSAAVKKAMEIPQGRRAVVLLTDGRDVRDGEPCSAVSVDDAIALAYTQRVPLYVVGLGDKIDETVLRRMAERTGGGYWAAPTPEDLADAYELVARLLRGQYLIRFESTGASGDHTIVVRVDRDGQQGLDAASFLIPEPPPTPVPTAVPTSEPTRTVVPPLPDEDTPWWSEWLYPALIAVTVVVGASSAVVLWRRRQTTLTGDWGGGVAPPTEDVISLGTLSVVESLELPEGMPYQLNSYSVTLGRGSNNDIDIPDKPVSRKHAELRYQDGEFLLYDRGSMYGTRVNGIEVPREGIRLADGDLIQLGTKTKLCFNRAIPETEDKDRTIDVEFDDGTTGDMGSGSTGDVWAED